MDYNKINFLIIDVDGTMTDAGIYYDEHGNEYKKFCTKDAAGFFAAREANMKIRVLTGRQCEAVSRRMTELKVDYIVQNIKDKEVYLKNFIKKEKLRQDEIGYLGDDLNDLSGMRFAGFVGCPADACEEVKSVADYVSTVKGGYGAVRDIISHILRIRGQWNNIIEKIYGAGI